MFLPISANLDVLDVNYQLLKACIFNGFLHFSSITTKILSNDPSLTTLSPWEKFCLTLMELEQRAAWEMVHIDG